MIMRCRWFNILIAGTIFALFPFSISAAPAPQPPPAKKHPLIFSHHHKNGDSYDVYYYLERETKYVMPIQGIKNPPLRTDKEKIILSGKLNCVIAERLYELSVESFSLAENGIIQKRIKLQGKILELDVANSRINVRNVESGNDGAFIQVVAATDTSDYELSREEEKILWSIFGSQGGQTEAVFGKDCLRIKGERWILQTDWIQKLMKQRGIKSTAKNWDSTATFEGVYPVKNIPANMVSVHLFSKKIPYYDCKIDIAVSLPVDEKINHGPIQIICDGLEIEQTALPDDQPFCNGAKFFIERRHQSLYTLTPVKK